MNLFRSRTLLLVMGLGLATLALRPFPPAERALAIALVPCRALVELVVPVEWLAVRRALAAEPSSTVDPAGELARHAALERMVLDSALPDRFAIPSGAGAAHGEVVGRDARDLDRVRVRVEGGRGLVPGLPVVSGDWFVGIVRAVDERPDDTGSDLWVQLVTDQDERIAARVEAADDVAAGEEGGFASGEGAGSTCRLVAGGLAPRADAVWLDVHNPSRREVRSGRVLVDERESLGGRYTALANGAWLGELTSERVEGQDLLGIRPGLDYGSGLYQVLVLHPEGMVRTVGPEVPVVLEDGLWKRARRFLRAQPTPWRDGVWVGLGRADGVRPGAAVVAGARLCGRVGEVGVERSSVLELGDPGLALAGLAVVRRDGREAPFVMGRIEGRGRTEDGAFLFDWEATVPIEGAADGPPIPAELWTGSGEPGVPRGLWVGTTELPRGPGPHRIVVRPPVGMARAGGWRVRVAADRIGEGTRVAGR